MTTVASDGKTVAADGQSTAHTEIFRTNSKKIRGCGDAVLGFTGVAALQPVIFAWFEEGADPCKIEGFLKDNDWTLAVFRKAGVSYYRNICPYPLLLEYPFSMGSGEDYASGALLSGATSRRAVEIAIEKDTQSGGTITEIAIPGVAVLAEAAE